MTVMNDLDSFHLVSDVIDRVPKLKRRAVYAKQAVRDMLAKHKRHVATYGEDLPEVRRWRWPQA